MMWWPRVQNVCVSATQWLARKWRRLKTPILPVALVSVVTRCIQLTLCCLGAWLQLSEQACVPKRVLFRKVGTRARTSSMISYGRQVISLFVKSRTAMMSLTRPSNRFSSAT